MPNAWHIVHLGSRAVGGAGLVITEATAISPEGRITPSDLGIWSEKHLAGHREITTFLNSQGAVAGIQLAHAGRKASRVPPWETDPSQTQGRPYLEEEGGWRPVAPSERKFAEGYTIPLELSLVQIDEVVHDFVRAAKRAIMAGYQWIEIHGAHGYLLHSFNSPISNARGDNYSGSLAGRCRLSREVAVAVRNAIPEDIVLGYRVSYTDWADKGWSLEDTIQMAKRLKEDGVDVLDVSSGGNVPNPGVISKPGYQVPGADAIRSEANVATAAVGWIDNAEQAQAIISDGHADLVFLGRELLRDPYWPLRAAVQLNESGRTRLPVQYGAAWSHLGTFEFDPISAPKISSARDNRVAQAVHTDLLNAQ